MSKNLFWWAILLTTLRVCDAQVTQCVVYQDSVGSLTLCNNLILNNVADSMTNLSVVPHTNIVGNDSYSILKDNQSDYRILSGSVAVDAGDSTCVSWQSGLQKEMRVKDSNVDVGAFEVTFIGVGVNPFTDTVFTVFQDSIGTLTLCNNLILNNVADSVTNLSVVPSTNIMGNDSYSILRDNQSDYRILSGSAAVDAGDSVCVSWQNGLRKEDRVKDSNVDVGAFEVTIIGAGATVFTDTAYTVLQDGVGSLTLCNNLILNNVADSVTNLAVVPSTNIMGNDSYSILRDNQSDYRILSGSAAVDAGDSTCVSWQTGLRKEDRVKDSNVDVGAFEVTFIGMGVNPFTDTVFTVFQDSIGTLNLCNNLILNNVADSATNLAVVPSTNIMGNDSYSILRDNQSDYRILSGSSAVDVGDSTCVSWENDLKKAVRIKGENVDVGAFEVVIENQPEAEVYAVQQDTTGQLYLYNNIVINNVAVRGNENVAPTNTTNLLQDTTGVFVDANDYRLPMLSPAVNAGDNQYIHIDYDIVRNDRRPCEGTVDQGAFEVQPVQHSVSLSAQTVMNETCNGHVTSLTATGGEHYTWSHSNETSATVIVNPLVPACYTVTAYVDGDCPWSDTATICIDPDELVENSMGSPSTEGKRFWVSFMRNLRAPVLSLLISSQTECTGLITNPNTGWSIPFSVSANQTSQISIPNDQAYCYEDAQVSDYGLLVTSTENISLYASNFCDHTYDVTNILPETALSDEYVAQAYTPLKNTEFLIVATADSTVVEIVPACMTSDNHTAYIPYTVVLNQGQTYQVLSKFNGNGGDLSGSVVRSTDISKPIAVFNGNVCANVPDGNRWCDHVVEQAFGTRFWGRNFVITNTVGLPYDRVKVTASADNTKLYKDGVTIALINAHQSFEFELAATDTVCYLEASNACAAYLYMAGGELNPGDDYRGDPSMVWLSPLEQRIQEITFATFNSPNITNHNVNIVAPTASVETVSFDGNYIWEQFHLVPSNPMFSYARLDIPNGTHTLNSWGGIVAHVYGTGHCETYAYSVGSKAAVLSEQMFVNQTLSSELESNEFCTYEPITFDAVVNYQCDSILWNFGDSPDNYNGYHFTHHYTQPGTYPVSMTVFLYDNFGQHCTTIYSQMEILDGYNVVWRDTVCQGFHYLGYEFDYLADTAGLVTLTRTVEIPDSECDSVYVVELFVNQRVFDYYDTICAGNDYNGYGFSMSDVEQGTYLFSDTVHKNPCDSIIVLHLLVTPNTNDIYGIHGMEYVCLGNTYSYWLDTLSGMTDLAWTLPQGVYLLSGQGTDQVTITITEESVVGDIVATGQNACGSATYSFTLHSMPVYYTEIVDTVCGLGQPYHKFGFDIDSVTPDHQVFVQNLLSESCCDSTIVLSLVIIDMPDVYIQADTYRLCQNDAVMLSAICQTESVDWYDTLNAVSPNFLWNTNDTTQTVLFTSDTSMTVSVTVTNAYGCSATADTLMTIIQLTYAYDTVSVCENQLPFSYHDTVFAEGTETGEYEFVGMGNNGCDSLMHLYLEILPVTSYTIEDTILQQFLPYQLNDSLYTETGEYTQHFTNQYGCDSVLTLHLLVSENILVTIDSVVCDNEIPFEWNGALFEQADTLEVILQAENGADSIVVMQLSLKAMSDGDDYQTVCDSLTWIDGITYYESTDTATYVLTNAVGCDSIVTLHLSVNYSSVSIDEQTACDSLTWINGVTYYESTDTATFVLANAVGCDSIVTLHLTIHHSSAGIDELTACDSLTWINGVTYYESTDTVTYVLTNAAGCDSVVTLHLMVNHFTTSIDTLTACDSLTWINGETYYESTDTATYVLSNIAGCDSIVTLHLTINHSTANIDTRIACDSLTWIDGITYYESTDTVTYVLANAVGCDSVVTLHLTINYSSTSIDEQTACDSLTWINGVTYYESTDTATYVLSNMTGCDSVITLHLTVKHATYGTDTLTACDSLTWIDGITYYESNDTATYTLTNAAGCDSVVTLHLTVLHSTTGIDTLTACDSLTWINGVTYYESADTVTYVLPNAAGCDSVVTLHLTVLHSTTGVDTLTACDSLTWINGITYHESTDTATYVLANAVGCDSVVTLHLTINYSSTSIDEQTACDSLTWINGVTYYESTDTATYVLSNMTGCDSVITLHLTVKHATYGTDTLTACDSLTWIDGITYYESNDTATYTLTNAAGCDSVVTMHLTVRHSTTGNDTVTACDSLTWINGVTYYESADTVTYVLPNAAGCDSVVTLHLTVNHSTSAMVDTAVVQNALPCHYNDSAYVEAGTYTQNFTNSLGCDSILTIHIEVYQNVTTIVDTTVCAADLPYTWHGHSFTAAGSHTVTLLTSHGADSVVTYHLSVDNISANVGNVTHITCYGESTGSATATVTGGQTPMTYAWTNASGTNISTTTSISNRPAGAYTFTVTDHIGCTATAMVTLNTQNGELQPGTIADNLVVCDGESIPPFTGTVASGGDNGAYQWQISTNGTDWTPAQGTNNAQTYTYPNPAANAFTLRRAWVSQSCGTVYSNTVSVEVAPNSSDTITAEVCQGDSYQENGFDITADQTAEAGEYTFEQHYSTGHCDSAVILLLTVNPEVAELIEDTVCEGEGYSGGGFEVLPQETIGESGLTRVQNLQTENGCDSVVTLQLTIIDTALRIEMLTEDFCEHNEAALTVLSQMPDYVWSTGETATTIVVSSPGIYSVTASEGGCSATAHIRVEGCHYELVLPNVITPSRGDGLNDCFYIPEGFTTNINLFKVYIYNRWGELVFYSTDKNFRWYGEYRGQTQYQTTYNYVIEYTDMTGRPFRRAGSVTVL